ncbi:MAG TPA: DUF222 domain-containing protein [Microbacterium sp.]|uniref:HNH endonuclease signature motif containing protein n=1 Tax=Microbacterium sp. TaxID=51671 RepID=UPI002B49F93A|nr:DUF222 domain-containing protein [Microbacterium sp.]HKT58066.1 DUF222 domain-containing protein [Microbacterium sp.]
MDSFAGIVDQQLRVLSRILGEVGVAEAAPVMAGLRDDEVVGVIVATTNAIRELEGLRVVAAGVTSQRSSRDAGHDGLAQRRGHRNAVSLVQELTGASRTQAGKAARLGESLLETASAEPDDSASANTGPDARPDTDDAPDVQARPWHACLGDAFTAGRISLDQQSAIRRGLGDPPATGPAVVDPETVDAWRVAAEQLIDEAARRTVEDLGAAARIIRDRLDPDGAQRRFDDQFQARSFRMWTTADGVQCARIQFEAGGGAWATSILDAALRPRRGGPRFVDPDEKAAADALAADPRTNEQLAYDLFIDVLHAGALADAAQVFGTRQAGIRVVVNRAAQDAARAGRPGTAVIEDTHAPVPAAFAAQRACDTGTLTCTTDSDGNPLDLGREARLFTPKQRLVLAVRDGGCVWPGCDRSASYCEAHHIDHYAHGGRTDVRRGILLCAFHHRNLHHHGWSITRDGTGPFVLHSPDSRTAPTVLQPPLERRYLWGDLQPPPTRFRPAA